MNITRRKLLASGASIAVLGGVSVSCTNSKSTIPNWSNQPSLPLAMQEIYPSVFHNEIYVGGGFAPQQSSAFFGLSPSKQVFIFNPAKSTWRVGPTLPRPRHHLGMVRNSKYLFAIGGYYGDQGNAWQPQNTVFKLSKDASNWEPANNLPQPQTESVYAAINDNIHVVGGRAIEQKRSKIFTDSVKHLILIDNEHWEEAAPASIARNSATGGVINNKLFVIGGRNSGKAHSNAEVYDPTLDKWKSIKPSPVALAGQAATVFENKLYIFGGEKFGEHGGWKTGEVSNSVWCYDPQTDLWEYKNELSMPKPLHGHGVISYKGLIYIIGGAIKSGPVETTSSMYSLKCISLKSC